MIFRLITMFRILFICIYSLNTINAVISDLTTTAQIDTIRPMLEPINGTRNFRMHGKKGKDEKSWYDGREMRHIFCLRPAKCEELSFKTCLGSPIPYTSTSLDLTDSYSQGQTVEKLYSYQALRYVPKCWSVIQPFLCAVYAPKCEKINGRDMVFLPSLEMCKITLEPCRILYNTSYFPEFLKCNETFFPPKCNNDVREMKFNTTGECLKPLVPADLPSNNYEDIEGCGIQCKDPLYTDDEHRQIQKTIAWLAGICLVCNIFTIFTYIIDWRNAKKFPSLVVYYFNICYMVLCVGWLQQFLPGSRDDIVCHKDGTLRHSEPSSGENLYCLFVFILVYYFSIAAMIWFAILTYSWLVSFMSAVGNKCNGNMRDQYKKKGSYFHLIAWSVPLVLTISIMALSEVDGNSVLGICFVGYFNHAIRTLFLLAPLALLLVIGSYFSIRGFYICKKHEVMSGKDKGQKTKLHRIIVRMVYTVIIAFIAIVASIICHFYEFNNSEDWASHLRKYIICRISSTYTDTHSICKIEKRPSVTILQIHLFCFFIPGIVMATWVVQTATFDSWNRYFRSKLGKDDEEQPMRLQKHKVIAKTFARRKEIENEGRISLYDSHTDPVGLNFDINSVKGSNGFSSTWETWEHNIPRFMNRRNACTGAVTSSSCDPRKSSIDSEISFSFRQVSVESRRNSVDSQVSVKIAEMKTTRKTTKNRQKRRNLRKESSTSVESQSQIIASFQKGRRTGIGAIDVDLQDFIQSNKLFLPQLALTTSDDDNVSAGSFKMPDSKFLKQIGATADVNLHHQQHQSIGIGNAGKKSDCQIVEYNSSDEEKFNSKAKTSDDDDDDEDYKTSQISQDKLKDNVRNSKEFCGRTSKNSTKSIRSKKSSRQGTLRRSQHKMSRCSQKNQREKKVKEKEKEKEKELEQREKELELFDRSVDFNNSSFTSYCSELAAAQNIQSSYSGISLANSRNSKRSCDVGIQTNAHELASFEFTDKNAKNEENEDLYTENHQLIPKSRKETITRKRNTDNFGLTESDKLKMLLLPSKAIQVKDNLV
uniref:Putative smoothened n=1 Tax=Corethrella appendiculata TaxID=1370023 RepID=U5EP59_9DIPT